MNLDRYLLYYVPRYRPTTVAACLGQLPSRSMGREPLPSPSPLGPKRHCTLHTAHCTLITHHSSARQPACKQPRCNHFSPPFLNHFGRRPASSFVTDPCHPSRELSHPHARLCVPADLRYIFACSLSRSRSGKVKSGLDSSASASASQRCPLSNHATQRRLNQIS